MRTVQDVWGVLLITALSAGCNDAHRLPTGSADDKGLPPRPLLGPSEWSEQPKQQSPVRGGSITSHSSQLFSSGTTVIDFEGFECRTSITSQYVALGVTFSGAEILRSSLCLNPDYPPHSGTSVVFDWPTGDITAGFSVPVVRVGGFVTGLSVITLECFDAANVSLGSSSTPGANFVGNPGGLPQNIFLEVVSPGITRCSFRDGGNTYTVDDFTFGGCGGALSLADKAACLAPSLVGGPYLGDGLRWGGKGWDYSSPPGYAEPNTIKTRYTYWNNKLNKQEEGAGVDCSGLVLWSYNKASGATKYLGTKHTPNAVVYQGADGQYKYNSNPVDPAYLLNPNPANLLPGDLMFFGDPGDRIGHVAMYIGGSGQSDVVHALCEDVVYEVIGGVRTAVCAGGHVVLSRKDCLINGGCPEKENKRISGFAGFRRIRPDPDIKAAMLTNSPVDLIVTDPDGFTISRETFIVTAEEYLQEIPGILYYADVEAGSDGRPRRMVYSPLLKTGDYFIKVVPAPDALPTDVYSLEVMAGPTTIALAKDVPINRIPSLGYGIQSSTAGVVNSFVPVGIDIKPGSYPNTINLGSKGTVPVAVLGSNTLDATKVNPHTVRLAGAPVGTKPNGKPMASFEDANGDGVQDLVVHIVTKSLQLTKSDVKASLVGKTLGGETIKGSDSVRIVP